MANLSLTETYPDNSIWIGYFPAGIYQNVTVNYNNVSSTTAGTQAVCSAYTEVGWPISGAGLSTNYGSTGGSSTGGVQTLYTSSAGTPLPEGSIVLTMLSTSGGASGTTTKTPLYIICVGRSTSGVPAALPAGVAGFSVTWT